MSLGAGWSVMSRILSKSSCVGIRVRRDLADTILQQTDVLFS